MSRTDAPQDDQRAAGKPAESPRDPPTLANYAPSDHAGAPPPPPDPPWKTVTDPPRV